MKKPLAFSLLLATLCILTLSASAGPSTPAYGWKDDLFWLFDLQVVFDTPEGALVRVLERAIMEAGETEFDPINAEEAKRTIDGGDMLFLVYQDEPFCSFTICDGAVEPGEDLYGYTVRFVELLLPTVPDDTDFSMEPVEHLGQEAVRLGIFVNADNSTVITHFVPHGNSIYTLSMAFSKEAYQSGAYETFVQGLMLSPDE